jgi:YD repeat-containing protein
MLQPDGWSRPFYRKTIKDTVLNGGFEWKAEIKGDSIVASASCGWRLTYVKGRLAGMTSPKNKAVEFIYSAGRVTEVRVNGHTRLSLGVDSTRNEVTNVLCGDKDMRVSFEDRPRVQIISGVRVIGSLDRSVHEFALGADFKRFTYGTNTELEPYLDIQEKYRASRHFSWNPASKMTTHGNGWTYQIAPAKSPTACASIIRTNEKKQKESWFRDVEKGTNAYLSVNGVLTTKYTFLSGMLTGRTRKIEETVDGKSHVVSQMIYDDKGRKIREVDREGVATLFKYDDSGNLVKTERAGVVISERTFGKKGEITKEILPNGERIENRVSADGSVERTILEPNGVTLREIWKDGQKVRAQVASGGWDSYRYDGEGRAIERTDSEGNLWGNALRRQRRGC